MTRDIQIKHQFIKAKHRFTSYELKEDTKTSYYATNGDMTILPCRLSFMDYSGKDGIRNAAHQIKGKYKLNEHGKYYDMNSREVHSKVMPVANYPAFFGWGEIDVRFNRYDLIIIHSSNQCRQSFTVHHFEGMAARLEYLNDVCEYLRDYVKQQRPR
jgi:hypothetical protein